MTKNAARCLLFLLLASATYAQAQISLYHWPPGTVLPTHCGQGDLFYKTDVNWNYLCVETDTWVVAGETIARYVSNGSTQNLLQKALTVAGVSRAADAATTDTLGIIGIAQTAATAGQGVIVGKFGQFMCAFDGPTTAGDYVQASTTVAGQCHDAGASYPTSGQVVGRVTTTNAGGGSYVLELFGTEAIGSGAGAVSSVFGRTGAVTAQTGDYSCANLSDAASGCSTAALASNAGAAHKFFSAFTAPNSFTLTQPACADLSDGATGCSTTVGTAATHAATDFATAGSAVAGGTCTNQAATAISSNGVPTCTTLTSAYTSGTFPATTHNILSATHGDTTAASAVRGDGIFAVGATPTWQRLAHSGATGGYFKWNGTDVVASTLAAAGTGSCTNQAVTAANADAAPTCTTLTSAYVDSTVVTTAVTLTANQLIFGNGTGSVKVGNLTGDVTTAGGTAASLAHTYPISFGTTTAPGCGNGGGVTTFIGLATSNTTENTNIQFIPTEAYAVSRMYVKLNGNVPAGQSLAVAVMDNAAAQAVTCTIAAGASACNDTAHTFTATAGDRIDIRFVCTGGTTSLTAPVQIGLGLK